MSGCEAVSPVQNGNPREPKVSAPTLVRRLFINRPEKHKLTKSIHRYNTDKDSPAMEVRVTSWRDEEGETQREGEP